MNNLLVSILAAVASATIINVAAALVWGGNLMARLNELERRGRENLELIARLDRDLRQAPLVEYRVNQIEMQIAVMRRILFDNSGKLDRVVELLSPPSSSLKPLPPQSQPPVSGYGARDF